MRVRLGAAGAWTVLGLSACGITRTGAPAVEQDPEDPPVPAFCASANREDPVAPVAAAFDGLRLVTLDGTGVRRVLHEFAVPADVQARMGKQIIIEPNRITAVVAWSYEDETTGEPILANGESVRFDGSGKLIWRLDGSVTGPSDAGGVTTIAGAQLLAGADGTLSEFPAPLAVWTRRSFMTAPDADDWLLAMGSTADAPPGKVYELGLVNLDGKRFVELPTPPTGAYDVRTVGGKHLYLTAEGTWILSFAGAAGVHSVDLSIPLDQPSPSLAGTGPWAVVIAGGKPVRRVDIEAERVFPIDSAAADAAIAARIGYASLAAISAGQWVLGSVDDDPVWLVDAATGQVETIALDRLSPLRHLDGGHCNHASFPHEGLIGVGLRDATLAGFYVGTADGTGWTRIGRPYRDVQGIFGRRVANTWILYSASGENTYCPGFRPFDPSPDDDAIVGDAIQIVPPNAPPLVFEDGPLWSPYSFELDPTGMCAYRESGDGVTAPVVIDLGTGRSVSLTGLADFAWLSD